MAIKARYLTWGFLPNHCNYFYAKTGATLSNVSARVSRLVHYVENQVGEAVLEYNQTTQNGGGVAFSSTQIQPSDVVDGDITQLFIGQGGYQKRCAYGDSVDVTFEKTVVREPQPRQTGLEYIQCQVPSPNGTDVDVPISFRARVVKDVVVQGGVAPYWSSRQTDVFVDPDRGEVFNSTTNKYIGPSQFLVGTSFELPSDYTKGDYVNETLLCPDGTSSSRYKDGTKWRVGTTSGVTVLNYGPGCWRYDAFATAISSVEMGEVEFEQIGPISYSYDSGHYVQIQAKEDCLSSVTLWTSLGAYSQYYNFYNASGEAVATLNKGWFDLLNVNATPEAVAIAKYGAGAYVETSDVPATTVQFNHGGAPPGAVAAFEVTKHFERPSFTLYLDMVDKNGDPSLFYLLGPHYNLTRLSYGDGYETFGDEHGNLEFYEG